MRSTSSACLILMLTLTELMEPSISTFSFSLRLTTTGVRRTSFEPLHSKKETRKLGENERNKAVEGKYLDSTSGLLCRSTCCDEKLLRQRAAVRVERTAARYGRSVFD
ncbi:hypothetical protein HK096_001080 [Nowakowskiella sp. JEL0078]|nr:hypothetical protein HK096_001080 [Nowakowskiella sp. JEL0078]